ncbi:MBL fold metallo-hydrolase [Tessaracoccus oleiagri]|uniref:Glyoxylase, beta-lactamase superfamily II n=1 Tax=Tessaracoccus oleiagri TaxID=686624 RepID=A0A1G9IF40_9ACTN|nr:MBL fold metallo-hydrolase [Tessaracoccus oleiagri]SDL23655.1 Glyoxylase, beta-lactamase superfamily II [Tessaracoccus oleiagri]
MAEIITIETPTLGDRSYVVHDGRSAIVIDPQRDIDRVVDVLERAGVQLEAVFETHIHNDYITGGLALARKFGADYYVNAADEVSFERSPIADGQVVEVSPTMHVKALATPGHTFTHLSYVLIDPTADDHGAEGRAVFTGGSLLFGATGRPDLLGEDHTHELVRHQYHSAQRLAAELPESTEVLPTHGFGSFCSATETEGDESTIGREKQVNSALTTDEEEWIEEILAGLDVYPAYYAHMAPANAAGPTEPDLSEPTRADREEIRARLGRGEWVVDLRNRTAYAAGHVPGSFNFGLDGSMATYLGWIIPWGTPLTLLGESREQVAEGQRELVRIGIDRVAASATGGPDDWTDKPATLQQADFGDLREVRHHRRVEVLDVRRASEFEARHIEGATNIPLHELLDRMDEAPGGEIWVHCESGYRSSIAASMLLAARKKVVAIDDDFDNAAKRGLPLTEAGVDGE